MKSLLPIFLLIIYSNVSAKVCTVNNETKKDIIKVFEKSINDYKYTNSRYPSENELRPKSFSLYEVSASGDVINEVLTHNPEKFRPVASTVKTISSYVYFNYKKEKLPNFEYNKIAYIIDRDADGMCTSPRSFSQRKGRCHQMRRTYKKARKFSELAKIGDKFIDEKLVMQQFLITSVNAPGYLFSKFITGKNNEKPFMDLVHNYVINKIGLKAKTKFGSPHGLDVYEHMYNTSGNWVVKQGTTSSELAKLYSYILSDTKYQKYLIENEIIAGNHLWFKKSGSTIRAGKTAVRFFEVQTGSCQGSRFVIAAFGAAKDRGYVMAFTEFIHKKLDPSIKIEQPKSQKVLTKIVKGVSFSKVGLPIFEEEDPGN